MKKSRLFIYGVLFMVLASCQQPSSSGNGVPSGLPAGSGSNQNEAKLQEKKNTYKILVDTEWEKEEGTNGPISSISFKNDSITINGTQYSLNQNTDLFFEDELPDSCEFKGHRSCPLYVFINNFWYAFEQFKFSKSRYANCLWVQSKNDKRSDMVLISTGGGQGGGEPSAFKGTYSFSAASGTESNGSISLNEGNWTYSGSKANVAAKSGTYSVNGSKITLSWTAGGSPVTEEFTITVNGSSATWQSSNTVSSTLFSMLFGVAGKTSLTMNYVE